MTNQLLHHEKAAETLLFLAHRITPLSEQHLIELCYQADRLHLGVYSRLITSVSYQLNQGQLESRELKALIRRSEVVFEDSGVIMPLSDLTSRTRLSLTDKDILILVADIYRGVTEHNYSATYPKCQGYCELTAADIKETLAEGQSIHDHLYVPF